MPLKEEIQALKTNAKICQLLRNSGNAPTKSIPDWATWPRNRTNAWFSTGGCRKKSKPACCGKGGPAAAKLEKTISELKARQDAYDQDVARLMDEDESINQEIAENQKAITENAATASLRFNERLETITEIKKTNHRHRRRQSWRKSLFGDQITGPHSIFKLQENLKRLSIVETDKPDHDGVKRWRFELAPFR
jgi:hypothetical protein